MGKLRKLDPDEIEEVQEILEDRHPLYYNGTTISDLFPLLKNVEPHDAEDAESKRILEEDILPHRNSIENRQIEEERRLLYVGITRARTSLAMTYCAERKQFGEKIEATPSRFLDELPEDDLQWEGPGNENPERNKATGKATLDALFKDLAEDS